MKVKAHTVVGRGEKRLRSDPGCQLHLGREKEKGKRQDNGSDGHKS